MAGPGGEEVKLEYKSPVASGASGKRGRGGGGVAALDGGAGVKEEVGVKEEAHASVGKKRKAGAVEWCVWVWVWVWRKKVAAGKSIRLC